MQELAHACCLKCPWEGYESDCELKKFGGYCGPPGNLDLWGWTEWQDFVCPECGEVVGIYYDFNGSRR